jgi:hypothetical protein
MRVRMRVEVSGTRDGKPWPQRGQIAEFNDEEALELCASGIGEPVKYEQPATEFADAPNSTRARTAVSSK